MGGLADLLLNPSKKNYGGKSGGSKTVHNGQVQHHSGHGGPVNTSGPSFFTPSHSSSSGGGGGSRNYSAPSSSGSRSHSPVKTLQAFTGNFYRAPTKDEVGNEKRPMQRVYSPYGSTTQRKPATDRDALTDLLKKPSLSKEDRDKLTEDTKDYGQKKTYHMSRKAFGKLDEDQKAAVRFNTLLVGAREKDLKMQGKYTPDSEQKAQYDEHVRRMFGAGHGSRTFAPETVEVLRQIDFDRVGDDLDDYLGLKRAITDEDLKGMHQKQKRSHLLTTAFEVDTPSRHRVTLAGKISAKLAEHREKMARAGHLMTSFKNSAALERNDALLKVGGEINQIKPEIGFGSASDRKKIDEDLDVTIRGMIRSTSRKNLSPSDKVEQAYTWGKFKEIAPPEHETALFRYADTKTRLAKEFDLKLRSTRKNTMTPDEYRTFLGLGHRTGDE